MSSRSAPPELIITSAAERRQGRTTGQEEPVGTRPWRFRVRWFCHDGSTPGAEKRPVAWGAADSRGSPPARRHPDADRRAAGPRRGWSLLSDRLRCEAPLRRPGRRWDPDRPGHGGAARAQRRARLGRDHRPRPRVRGDLCDRRPTWPPPSPLVAAHPGHGFHPDRPRRRHREPQFPRTGGELLAASGGRRRAATRVEEQPWVAATGLTNEGRRPNAAVGSWAFHFY